MVTIDDMAPDFTLPLASGESYDDVSEFTLSEAMGDGPIVLAFVPAAFTGGCTEEMCTIGGQIDKFEALDASVYGVSVDLPFAQNVWIQKEGFDVPMLADWNNEVTRAYDVVYEGMYGMLETAQRSVFIIDDQGVVTYRWVREGDNPEFGPFVDALRDRVAEAQS